MSSGVVAWLYEQVRERYPEDAEHLIAQSKQRGNNKIKWLLQQLEERGAVDIREGYRIRVNAARRERVRLHKTHMLAGIERQLAGELNDHYREWLERRAKKLREYFAKRPLQ